MLETSTSTLSAEIPGQAGLTFNLLPITYFLARCYMVVEEGTHFAGDSKIAVAKCRFGFELPLNKHTSCPDSKPKPFTISLGFTRSLEENSKLRKMLESWLGQPFTNQSISSFRMENLIGKNVPNHIHPQSEQRRKATLTVQFAFAIAGWNSLSTSDPAVTVLHREMGARPQSIQTPPDLDASRGFEVHRVEIN